MADFEPGTKVICVEGNWLIPDHWMLLSPFNLPVLGTEYIVRTFEFDRLADEARREILGPGIRLHWLINPMLPTALGPIEPHFVIRNPWTGFLNFRPVIEKKTDISVFETLLIKTKQPELV